MCGGRIRVPDVVTDSDDIARLLHGARAPPPGFILPACPGCSPLTAPLSGRSTLDLSCRPPGPCPPRSELFVENSQLAMLTVALSSPSRAPSTLLLRSVWPQWISRTASVAKISA